MRWRCSAGAAGVHSPPSMRSKFCATARSVAGGRSPHRSRRIHAAGHARRRAPLPGGAAACASTTPLRPPSHRGFRVCRAAEGAQAGDDPLDPGSKPMATMVSWICELSSSGGAPRKAASYAASKGSSRWSLARSMMVSRCTVVTDDEEAFAEERGVLFEVVLQRRLAGQGCGLQALRGIPVDPPHPHLDWHDSQPPRKRPRLQYFKELIQVLLRPAQLVTHRPDCVQSRHQAALLFVRKYR